MCIRDSRNTERSLEGLAREMKSIGTRMGNNLANGISNATSGITRTLNNVVGKVNSTIGNINSALSGIESAFSFSYDVTGPTGNRRWGYYNMSLPRAVSYTHLSCRTERCKMGQTCTTTVVRFDGKIYVTGNISLFRRWFLW